jgi:hypothetical protein
MRRIRVRLQDFYLIYNIGLISSASLNSAPVFARTSSTVTPSASSISVKPSVKSTSNTHYNQSVSEHTHQTLQSDLPNP